MKIEIKLAYLISLTTLSAYAADMGSTPSELSHVAIKNSPSFTAYAGIDGKTPQSWNEVANKILFYNKGAEYYQLTNFYLAAILLAGKIWPTSEHYYQAAKFTDMELQKQIREKDYPRQALELAHQNKDKVRSDWNNINLGMMAQAVYQKFLQHEDLKKLLIDTGNNVLIEDAQEKDKFYGAGPDYKGQNYLGRILMAVRAKLVGEKDQLTSNAVQ